MKHDHDLAGDMSQMLEHPSWKAKIMCPDCVFRMPVFHGSLAVPNFLKNLTFFTFFLKYLTDRYMDHRQACESKDNRQALQVELIL